MKELRFAGIISVWNVFFLVSALPAHAEINVLYGDIDGFGFSTVENLTDGAGNPADKNMNGILDAGDVLPNLGTDINIEVCPICEDFFDNQSIDDPVLTDAGLTAKTVLNLDFNFSIPQGHTIKGASFSIVAGDISSMNQDLHTISIDGKSTGEILKPLSKDGEITETIISIDSSHFDDMLDGMVTVSLAYDVESDDIAIDYARLSINTAPRSLPWLPLLLE